MKKQTTKKELSPTLAALISASITAVATVLVAVIGILPQLRADDAQKAQDLRSEVATLTKTVAGLTITAQDGRNGTQGNLTDALQAPHIQLRWAAVAAPAYDEYLNKATIALTRGGFTGVGNHGDVVFGFNREYTGLVWHISPDAVIFIAAGPDWQTADKDAENLKRGF
jgi:hypothetical protein